VLTNTNFTFYQSIALVGVTIGSNGHVYVCGGPDYIAKAPTTLVQNWTDVSPSAGGLMYYDISSLDGTNVIAVASRGAVRYSSDAGTTWATPTTSISTSITLYAVTHSPSSALLAMIAGSSSYVAKTSDGGQTWTKLTVFSSSIVLRFHCLSMISDTTAYIAGTNGELYETSDFGTTWSRLAASGATLYSLSVHNSTKVIAGGASNNGIYIMVDSKFVAPLCRCSLFDKS
jgi:photosystem II stability/assembly factor-like uncharacterized protein